MFNAPEFRSAENRHLLLMSVSARREVLSVLAMRSEQRKSAVMTTRRK